MYIAKNLQYLRKRNKITQEELADKLGVSRQSVSKWETGDAYPETDKLILLCDLFDVSMDSLMRSDITGETTVPEEKQSDNGDFCRHMDSFSKAISAGVMLILIGVAICVAMAGVSERQSGFAGFAGITGAIILLFFVAVAVFLFVFYGMKHERFVKEHPQVGEAASSGNGFLAKHFMAVMACLVSGILLDIVMLVALSSLIDAKIITVANADEAYCYVTAAFLAILAVIVGGLVYCGIQRSKLNPEEYNRQSRENAHPTARKRISDAVCGSVMLIATALFLVMGFVWNLWHPGWVVFPIGGIVCAIVNTVAGASKGEK